MALATESIRVLVVDDDTNVTEFLEAVLRRSGRDVCAAYDGDEALKLASEFKPHVLLLDIDIPRQDGWLVCTKLKSVSNAPAVILITGTSAPQLDGFASFVDADDVLRKPFSAEELVMKVDKVVAAKRTSA